MKLPRMVELAWYIVVLGSKNLSGKKISVIEHNAKTKKKRTKNGQDKVSLPRDSEKMTGIREILSRGSSAKMRFCLLPVNECREK